MAQRGFAILLFGIGPTRNSTIGESIVLAMVVWAAALLLAISANPLMLHASGVSDAVQRTSTVELGESAEAAINAEEASLNKQTSLTEDELLRSTKGSQLAFRRRN